MTLITLSIWVYTIGGVLQLFFKEKHKCNFLIFMNFIAAALAFKPIVSILYDRNILETTVYMGQLLKDVAFRVDALSAFFIMIICGVGLLGTIYSKKYLEPYIEQGKKLGSHLFLFNVFLASMLLVVMSQNIIFFLISWELMSFSSFLLMIFEHEEKEVRQSGINYLITMHVGVMFLVVGFILMYLKTGSFDFSAFSGQISELVFAIMFIGFGIKAGFVPLHSWLPKAHPVAPTHISALMSGVMIKTGIYGILRMLLYMGKPTITVSYCVLLVGLASAFFGILYAVAQRNYKKMLAYSSIENIGIITTGMAVAMLGMAYNNFIMTMFGFLGCFLHILNHSIFKTMMFFNAGAVYTQTHTKDMEKLGGLVKPMKNTAILFLLGSLAISALPPFNGFISEFLIYIGFLTSFSTQNYFLYTIIIAAFGIIAFVGAMALIAFTNAFSIIFLGSPRTEKAQHVKEDVSIFMQLPIIVLAFCSLVIGLFPQRYIDLVVAPVQQFIPFSVPYELLTVISIFNITLCVVILIVIGLRALLLKGRTVEHRETWGCGYQYPTAKIQYSANSFTRPFLGFLTPFYKRELNFTQIKELFPQKTSFKSRILDIFEYYIIKPIVIVDEFIISKFYWIQSGHTQRYLIYGVVFLIVAIALLIGGKI